MYRLANALLTALHGSRAFGRMQHYGPGILKNHTTLQRDKKIVGEVWIREDCLQDIRKRDLQLVSKLLIKTRSQDNDIWYI